MVNRLILVLHEDSLKQRVQCSRVALAQVQRTITHILDIGKIWLESVKIWYRLLRSTKGIIILFSLLCLLIVVLRILLSATFVHLFEYLRLRSIQQLDDLFDILVEIIRLLFTIWM